jgi:hypothetical protein
MTEAPAGRGLAIASLVLGICGLCTAGLSAMLGIVFAAIALTRGSESVRRQAVAGLVVSCVTFLLMPIVLPLIGLAIVFRRELSGTPPPPPPPVTRQRALSFADEPVVWSTAEGGSGHGYALTTRLGTWEQARSEAVARGGHLASVGSAAEGAWLMETFGPVAVRHSGDAALWIGLTDSREEGVWAWTSGEPLTCTNWASGEPNSTGNEDWCVMTERGWNDTLNDDWGKAHFGIIEFGPGPAP